MRSTNISKKDILNKTEEKMSKKRIITVASLAVVCVVVLGIFASEIWVEWFAGKWTNRYSYWFYIDCDADLYNVTLYIPILMAKGEISQITNEIFQSMPSNWTAGLMDTEYGKMVKISASTIYAGYYSVQGANYVGDINVEKPTESEPVLQPRVNDTGTTYKSYLYATYNTLANTKLTISIRIRGEKERGIGAAIDIRGYEDAINCTIIGESSGWHVVDGVLEKRGV